MDYNKFEDRISRWIENDMDVKERKEFEKKLFSKECCKQY